MKTQPRSTGDWLAHLVTLLTAAVVLVTAIVVRPGIEAFLLIVTMLGGAGTVFHAMIHRGNRRWSGVRSLSLGSFGLVLFLFGWLELSMQPGGVPAIYKLPLAFVLMLSLVALMREDSRDGSGS
jgi:hypothetical protein